MLQIQELQLKTSLMKVIKQFQSFEGRRVSVREISLTSIFVDNGIHQSQIPIIIDLLKKKGLYESDGIRGGLKYKFSVETLEDSESIASWILEQIKKNSLKLSAFKPKKLKSIQEFPKSSDVKLTKVSHRQIFEKVYFFLDNKIQSGWITSITSINDCLPAVGYEGDIIYQVSQDRLNLKPYLIKSSEELHSSVDELLESLKSSYTE